MSSTTKQDPAKPDPGKFTDPFVRNIKVPAKGDVTIMKTLDEGGRALILRASYGGARTWKVLYYRKGKPRAQKLGRYPAISVKEAYKLARAFEPDKAIAAATAGTFKDVAEEWFREYVETEGLRSAAEIRRQLETYIYPFWEDEPIYGIGLSKIQHLLDKIRKKEIKSRYLSKEKRGGPSNRGRRQRKLGGRRQAEAVLATIRSIMTWYEGRDENYRSDIHRVQRSYKSVPRKRVLSDDEVRAVWRCAGKMGVYGSLVQVLLLTGQRLSKVQFMQRSDVQKSLWTIRSEEREKGNAEIVRLPKMVLEIIEQQPIIDGNPYVFPASVGRGPINSFSKSKKLLDEMVAAILPDVPAWRLHDLRRTARTRMSKLKIDRTHSELVIGHKLRGVEGTYDRHDYIDEMSAALSRLARHVGEIVQRRASSARNGKRATAR